MKTCSLISSLFHHPKSIYIRNSTSTFQNIYNVQTNNISNSINRNSEAETSTTMNDSSNSCSSIRTEHSDEESILLVSSSKPKKRAAGRKKFKETRHPVFRGVRKRNNDKWVCEIREPTKQKRIWLGTYPTAEMAARAHDVAALSLKGELATLNFTDSAWRLQVPISKDPKELRQAAASAAEAFEPVREVAPQDNKNNVVDCNMVVDENDNSNSCGIEEWVANMEEESLFSPNPYLFGSHFNWDDYVESDVEVSLWNYTI